MSKIHNYSISIKWKDIQGEGTRSYTSYSRNHSIEGVNKLASIPSSSDPSFRGDKDRYNPEELFLASISSCHMLWYLHLCTVHNITVVDYTDNAEGKMEETSNGSGQFKEVTLYPSVTIKNQEHIDKANELHHQANKMCFIANSCNFKIHHNPNTKSL